MSKDELKLKPCPFCGGDVKENDIVTYDGFFFVRCQTCIAYGPYEDSNAEAVETWNKRHGDSLLTAAVREEENPTRAKEYPTMGYVQGLKKAAKIISGE